MTASRSNLERLQRWYATYEGRGLQPAEDLMSHDEALRAAEEMQSAQA